MTCLKPESRWTTSPGRDVRQRGFSLVEIALAIALVAGVVVAGAIWVNRIQLDQQLNSTRNDAVATMNAAVTAYASIRTTASATPAVLSSQNVWPLERVTGQGTAGVIVRGHFQGSREFMWGNTAQWGSFTQGVGFIYHITNVPATVCSQLVIGLASQPYVHRAWAGTYVQDPTNGGTPAGATALTAVKTSNVGAVNMATLASACSGTARKHVAFAFFKA